MAKQLMAKENEREIHPEGMYKGVCLGVHDLGMQDTKMFGYKRQVLLRFETSALMKTGDNAGKPFTMSGWYSMSMNKKSTLRAHVEGFLGRSLTAEEAKNGYNLYLLEGKNCFITVTHSESGRAVIKSISPLPEEMKPLIPHNKIGDEPDWVKEIIKKQVVLEPIKTTESEIVAEANDIGAPF